MWRRVLAALFFSLAPSCPEPAALLAREHASWSSGTTDMVERLRAIARQADPAQNLVLNRERAELIRRELHAKLGSSEELRLRTLLSVELMRAGDTTDAIDELLFVQGRLRDADPPERGRLRELLSIAYLRRGEQRNCVLRHNADSCLLPIRSSGVHELQEDARLAVDALTRLLDTNPESPGYRWLLNVAYMSLGAYPNEVPRPWLLPPARLDSEHELPRFTDVATSSGVATIGLSGGAVMEDFDGDGALDLMVSSWGLHDQLRFYRNRGEGTFTDRTIDAGLQGEVGGLNLTHADYDNDGDMDVLVLRGGWLFESGRHPNSLLRNMGDGTFEDATLRAGLLSEHPTQTAAWADFDNDGWLDLFIGNESAGSSEHACELFRNNADGTFTDVAGDVGLAHVGFVKAVSWGDYDRDGDQDLYLSRFGQENVLYRNAGRDARGWSFEDVTLAAGVSEPILSFPTWFWDYDNDGWLDLFVGSFTGFTADSLDTIVAEYWQEPVPGNQPKLYRNNRDGTFRDVTGAIGLDRTLAVMGANFGDIDNDGFPDAYLGTGEPSLKTLVPNRMFRNDRGRWFQDVTTAGGFGHLQKGHAVTFGDVDRDGDQDVYAVMGGAYSGDVYQNVLFQNPGNGNHWITMRFVGAASNRSAVGARIRVSVETDGGAHEIYGTVGAGGSFGSSSLQQETGLGRASSIVSIEVAWPSGSVQRFTGARMDRVILLRENEPHADELP